MPLIGNRNGWFGFDRSRTSFMPNQSSGWGAQGPLALGSALKTFVRADSVKGRTAAQFTAANSEKLDIASNSTLQAGDIDFYWCGWIYIDAAPAAYTAIFLKGTQYSGTTMNYGASILSTRVPGFDIADGTNRKTATWGSALSLATWYFIEGYHNAAADVVGVCINRGTDVTAATAGVVPASGNAGALTFGKDPGGGQYFDGRIQHFTFLKRLPSAAERNALYASGAGVNYADNAIATTSMVSWWSMTEESGTRADSHGTNTLTDTNTVTSNDGKVAYAVTADGSVVYQGTDQGTAALAIVQATHANKPLLKTNIINGQAVLRFDGSNDTLKVATGAISNQPLWGWAVVDDNDAGTRFYLDGGAASKVSISNDNTNLILNAGSAVQAAHSAGAPHLVTFIVNGASSDLRVDGASIATGDAGAQNQDSGVAVGADNAGASPLAGDIAEFAFVAGTPSNADIANLKAYINSRYNLGVA
jgi:hypothetical protein